VQPQQDHLCFQPQQLLLPQVVRGYLLFLSLEARDDGADEEVVEEVVADGDDRDKISAKEWRLTVLSDVVLAVVVYAAIHYFCPSSSGT